MSNDDTTATTDGAGQDCLRAFVTQTPELAWHAAQESDERAPSRLSNIDGMTVAIKDNFCMQGFPTTASSRMLENFIAPYDATVVARLRDAGAVIVGKTNMDEFGMGSASLNSHFGAVRNPLSLKHTAGGSSGGSAAAVAAGMCVAAIGSDTGGSVRQPAAYCGIVGVKPAYGSVSRHGLISYASSLDTPGVLAKTVPDAMNVLRVIAGPDPRDSTCWTDRSEGANNGTYSTKHDAVNSEFENKDLEGLTVGIVGENFVEELPGSARENWKASIEYLESHGAVMKEVSIPSYRAAVPAYYIIASAEATSNLSRYDGVRYGHRASEDAINDADLDLKSNAAALLHESFAQTRSEGFGDEVKRRLLSGNFVLSSNAFDDFYRKALILRQMLCQEFSANAFHKGVDVLVGPSTVGSAPTIAEVQSLSPAEIYASDALTVPISLAGLPAISVPFGIDTSSGLPLGIQIIGNIDRSSWQSGGCSEKMLKCAHALAESGK